VVVVEQNLGGKILPNISKTNNEAGGSSDAGDVEVLVSGSNWKTLILGIDGWRND